jgi:hypothetical protein
MQLSAKFLLLFFLLACIGLGDSLAARAQDVCAICGKQIQGPVYVMTDEVTGEKKLVCSDCIKLPRCSICGLPVKDGFTELPDGRFLCARDAKTVVLKADDAERICAGVKDDLDRLFARFTTFPDNVDVTAIDRIDVDSMFHRMGNDFESPDLLGCIQPVTVNGTKRYKMSLMTGMPVAELKETCAHEFSHAWVGENVPPERHARLARDAEEGFCEMVAYLLMDSQNEAAQKNFILRNHYTRGQVELFIAAENNYGFDAILDWMKFGTTGKLDKDHVEAIRDISPPVASNVVPGPTRISKLDESNDIATNEPEPPPSSVSAPATLPTFKLQGIIWSHPPLTIINGCTFGVNDQGEVPLGKTNLAIRCLAIGKNSVRIQEMDSGRQQELALPAN